MSVSRRHFLGSSAAIASALTTNLVGPLAESQPRQEPAALTSAAAPPWPVIALNRMGYGPRPNDIAAVQALGLAAYVDQQLNPASINDAECDARLAAARVRIRYPAHPGGAYPAVDEARPLTTLNKSTAELWPLANFATPIDFQERYRPFHEVRIATWIRALYSKRQLQETLVDFWHNHFNVNGGSSGETLVTFPVYDRDVIRANCLGNFRVFLEAVARSTAMLAYLDNASNRAGGGEGGNENYARELLELHTLGSDNYLKFYDNRREIGRDSDGNARGYIDDDVYEAARCLTGWTINPATGEFLYRPDWHDTNPKTALSPDGFPNIPRSQPDLKDARDVFDLLARHRGTARTICTKLCRRLIADVPPASVVDAAVNVWMANISAPDQIKRVVRVILLSTEFQTTWGAKVKRPFEATIAYLRATNAAMPEDDLTAEGERWAARLWQFGAAGHRLFEWPTPAGHPDLASYWSNSNGMLRRWNLPFNLNQVWGGDVRVDLRSQTNMSLSCTQIVDFWIGRLCGFSIDPAARQELIAFMAQGGAVNQPPRPLSGAPDWNDPAALTDRLNSMVQLLAMCPDAHAR
jgi:uncharacterized protein (DUF1800 family)